MFPKLLPRPTRLITTLSTRLNSTKSTKSTQTIKTIKTIPTTPETPETTTPTSPHPLSAPQSSSFLTPRLAAGITTGLAVSYQYNHTESTLHTTILPSASTYLSTTLPETLTQSPLFESFSSLLCPTVHANEIQKSLSSGTPRLPPRGKRLDFDLYGGLSPMDFRPFRCSDISVVTQDTCIYCFNLATPNSRLNLPVSSYVLARAEVNGETVIRPYTPISNFIGELPILVKTYPHAKMGRRFAALEVGDTMYFKGPFQTFVYEENAYDRLTLVAGGTGVTPMLQLIDKVLTNPLDRTKMHLILCNKDEFNMPLAAELNEFAETYPNRLRVTHLIDKPLTEEWDGLTGHISKELLLVSCGKPHPHHKVFVSGPPGFMKHVCGLKGEDYTQGPIGGLLSELGFTERDVFKF